MGESQHHAYDGELRLLAAAERHPPGALPRLGYVTPWNSRGYDFARRCRCRCARGLVQRWERLHAPPRFWACPLQPRCLLSSLPQLG